jgi:hypothetical protein
MLFILIISLFSAILFFGVIRLIIFEKYNENILDVILYIFFIDLICDFFDNILEFINDSYEED